MKRVKIYAGYVGMVFRDGELVRVLPKGSHWIKMNELCKRRSLRDAITPHEFDLDLLMQNKDFAMQVDAYQIMDDELGLEFENGILHCIHEAGRIAFWKSDLDREVIIYSRDEVTIPSDMKFAVVNHRLMSNYIRKMTVPHFHKGLLYIDGKFIEVLPPGAYAFWKTATSVMVETVPVRTQSFEVQGQEMLTKDKAALRINFTVNFTVTDVMKAVLDASNYRNEFYGKAQMALRGVISALTLDDLLEQKNEVSAEIAKNLSAEAKAMGLSLDSCGIKDIILPGEMKEIMNQVLVAQKRAQANSILRREENASTRNLLNTAKLMEDNEMLLKLKEMEYIEKVADKVNSISVSNGNQVLEQLRTLFGN
ncbi:MAG: slipin family protein [Flavobacteriales bacterium]|nr:slipin family protein [Flavobacteriales bacterium]